MKALLPILILASTCGLLPAQHKKHDCSRKTPEALAHIEAYKKIFATAKDIKIYEGLPHPYDEEKLLKQESKRKDVIKLSTSFYEYHFYSPAVDASNATELVKVLSGPNCLDSFDPKKCAFHPDYCLEWTKDKVTYQAFVCFGCSEIVVKHGVTATTLDFRQAELRKLLAIYDKKRPKPAKKE